MKNWLVFIIIMKCCLSCQQNPKPLKVGIIAYAGFPKSYCDSLRYALENYYGVQTIVLPSKPMPKAAYTAIKSPRFQAPKVLSLQRQHLPDTFNYVMGFTTQDICITKRDEHGKIIQPEWKYTDFGIMGLAYRPGNSAIVSTFRLKHTQPKIELERAKKVTIHEFGHNLGLPHCPNPHCVMTAANEKISTIDQESLFLCGECKKQIALKVKA